MFDGWDLKPGMEYSMEFIKEPSTIPKDKAGSRSVCTEEDVSTGTETTCRQIYCYIIRILKWTVTKCFDKKYIYCFLWWKYSVVPF